MKQFTPQLQYNYIICIRLSKVHIYSIETVGQYKLTAFLASLTKRKENVVTS